MSDLNQKQRNALDEIANFILYFTSDEDERERMYQVACDYVEDDHVLTEEDEA